MMQTLSSMQTLVGLRLPVLTNSEVRTRTQRVNCRNRRSVRGVVVSCSSERNEEGGMGSPSHNYAILKHRMEMAAKSEYYEEAARIRDSMRFFEDQVPVLRLRKLLKEAVADERFQDAARYRDELKAIAPHSLLKCSSDATTLGIRVQVKSVCIEGRSQPSEEAYFFEYKIKITNNTNRPVQLLRRHWMVTDANNKTENIWGIGVVGEQPAIFPKSSFEFSSTCSLRTQNGKMEGDFEMINVDRVGSRAFKITIAPFSLSILGDGGGDDDQTT
ncbi:hypothetical protein VNO78_02508 [Psophocarpus tetragonolobus]|uniref:Protein ApaG n=1 Tax=Psophocarpus tetragonolobus TaxID=3891 RepID=A0AAN9XUS5_PSOTE